MERQESSPLFPLGSIMPSFSLPNVDGSTLSSDNYFSGSPFSLVIFSCNHCPYVKGSEDMLYATIREYQKKGLKAVFISSNDPVQYPEDSFQKMKEKAAEEKMPAPYLFDESQAVAKRFDAACTPECFLFDGDKKLIFHGAVNNSPKFKDQAKENFVEKALFQAFSGTVPEPSFVHPIGCSIKWRF